MAKIKLPVSWEVCGFVEVEADSIEEAMEYFERNTDNIPLPDDGEYVDGSFALTCNEPEVIAIYNKPFGLSTAELMNAEFHFGFYKGVYKGKPTDYILLEMPHKGPDGVLCAKAAPIANGEMPVAIGEPVTVQMPDCENEWR